MTEKIDDLHKIAKALSTRNLTGEEIENIINKNIYPKDKMENPEDKDDKTSALGAMGLKPKNSALKFMGNYYTRACNFARFNISRKVKKKLSLPCIRIN